MKSFVQFLKVRVLIVNLIKFFKVKKMKQLTLQIKLEEYKQLRAEIRHFLERRGQTINFAILISLGVISVGLKLNNYIIFFTAFLLVWLLWFEEIRRMQTIIRTAAYIEIVIEKEIDGLSWETYNSKHSNATNFLKKSIANAFYPILLLLNGIIGLFVMNSQFHILPFIYFLCIFFIELVFILINFMITYKIVKNGKDCEIEKWKKIISNVD
jgi:hypothetical protein